MYEADKMPTKMTFEDLVMDSIYHMRLAKRAGDDFIFDELLDEIEMLFDLIPELSANFKVIKQEMDRLVKQNIKQIEADALTIDDNILKDIFKNQKKDIIKWEFRTDMLEAIINLMNDYHMIPFHNPFIGELSLGELDESQEIPYDEETENDGEQYEEYEEEPTEEPPHQLPPFPPKKQQIPTTPQQVQQQRQHSKQQRRQIQNE